MDIVEQLYRAARIFLWVSCTLTEDLEPQQAQVMKSRIAMLEQSFSASFLEDDLPTMQTRIQDMIKLGDDLAGLIP